MVNIHIFSEILLEMVISRILYIFRILQKKDRSDGIFHQKIMNASFYSRQKKSAVQIRLLATTLSPLYPVCMALLQLILQPTTHRVKLCHLNSILGGTSSDLRNRFGSETDSSMNQRSLSSWTPCFRHAVADIGPSKKANCFGVRSSVTQLTRGLTCTRTSRLFTMKKFHTQLSG